MAQREISTDKSQGYILLHRKMMDKPYFTNSQVVHMWVYMLFKANHKDNYFEMKLVKRGSFATSRKRIAEDTGINESKIERILKMLETEQEIEQQNCGKFRIITVLDWDRFQKVNSKMNNSETMNEQQRNNSETMNEHKVLMNNNANNESNDINTLQKFISWDWSADKLFTEWLDSKKEKMDSNAKSRFNTEYINSKKDAVIFHCESKGVKYKNYRATIQNWINSDISGGKFQ
jgi:hypothetical protein